MCFPPARQLSQLLKSIQWSTFGLQGFRPNWEQQISLSCPQRDMITACLIYFKLSLPAMVRWIGGPHVREHRNNAAIFAIVKEACKEQNTWTSCESLLTDLQPTSTPRVLKRIIVPIKTTAIIPVLTMRLVQLW
jgi:hypothetical protein